jgi:PqqD family protein of HPr-rel-A system
MWCLRPGQTLQYRQWDGECVLYNDLSGDTHLLGDGAIELLLALRRAPATKQALATVLQAEFDIDPAELVHETDTLLRDLQHLALIDRLAC